MKVNKAAIAFISSMFSDRLYGVKPNQSKTERGEDAQSKIEAAEKKRARKAKARLNVERVKDETKD